MHSARTVRIHRSANALDRGLCAGVGMVAVPLSARSGRTRGRPTRLKRHRAVATRYDKLAVRYEATVLVEAINEWL